MSEHLAHHGIKGQKWGVRRFQNPDGSLTDAGQKRYDKNIRRIEKAKVKSDKFKAKSAKRKLKANIYKNRRDRIKGRRFQTDISIARANRYDRKRARMKTSSLRYDSKAKRLKYKAARWEAQNKKLMQTPVSSI